MKKISFILSLLIVGTLLLAACGGTDADEQSQTPGVDMTPGAVTEVAPTTGAGSDNGNAATPTMENGAGAGQATEAATPGAATPGAANPGAATPTTDTGSKAGTAATMTPAATSEAGAGSGAVPVTGVNECNPTRVERLLDFVVADAQGNKIGEVDSLVMLRDTSAMTAVNAAGAQATPAAGNSAAGAAAAAGSQVAPKVAYVIVDVENSDNNVAVPFEAFTFKASAAGAANGNAAGKGAATAVATAAATAAADTAAVTPTTDAAGGANSAGAPGGANAGPVAADACVLTLNVKQDALVNAPAFSADAVDFTAKDWDKAFTSYWTQQAGLSIPQTGSTKLGAPVLVREQVNIDVRNLNGDDLGEVDEFIIDQKTGTVKYAVLAAGGFLGIGEKYIPVPIADLQWASEEGGKVTDAGHMILNTTNENLKNAPSFDDLDQLDTTAEGWDKDLTGFWNNLTGDNTVQPAVTPTVSK